MKAHFFKHRLQFKNPSGTSRGVLTYKDSWFLILKKEYKTGIGECSIIEGLSIDNVKELDSKIDWVSKNIHLGEETLINELKNFPALQMAIETAFLSLKGETPWQTYSKKFVQGETRIPINGLIWMGETDFLLNQIESKVNDGFRCLKMKVGSLDFESELKLLATIRKTFSEKQISLRVDANGAFSMKDAMQKLEQLSRYDIQFIEQPIQPDQLSEMKFLCQNSPIPIALDEELIGKPSLKQKEALLEELNPSFIVLKPSLLGGIRQAKEWKKVAEAKRKAKVIVTSALESNVGLNAITQWVAAEKLTDYQGLGTGQLFSNNIESPLFIENGYICNDNSKQWNQKILS